MPKQLRRLFDNLEKVLLVIFAILLLTDVLIGILARYIRLDVVFATELGKYLFIWLCMIGISAAAKDNQHIRLNYLIEKVLINRKITWVISQILFLIFALSFFFWGVQLTLSHLGTQQSAVGFSFPMYLFTAALPVGFGLTAIRIIADIFHVLKKDNPLTPWETSDLHPIESPNENIHPTSEL
ncbi:MAG: TRAP transporter small permease [Bacteroidetes bacterium]|nr:TRAP transporter small permease [Bacteroidota bacterium]MDA1118983.1 TRAP transporter small permease [Bacteroidota bacterium]